MSLYLTPVVPHHAYERNDSLLSYVKNNPVKPALAAALLAYSYQNLNWLTLFGAACLACKTAWDWTGEPLHFMPKRNGSGSLKEEVQALFNDLINCGLRGDNIAIATQRYNALRSRQPTDDRTYALLHTIHAVLTRKNSAPDIKTLNYDLERLYFELTSQNKVPSKEQIKMFNDILDLLTPYENNPEFTRQFELLCVIAAAIDPNAKDPAISAAFEARSLFLSLQNNPGKNLHEAATRYSKIYAACTPDTLLRAEINDDLVQAYNLIWPGLTTPTASSRASTSLSSSVSTSSMRASSPSQTAHIPASSSSYAAVPADTFNPLAWCTKYQTALSRRDNSHYAHLAEIARQTMHAAKHGYAVNGRAITLDPDVTLRMQKRTRVYHTTEELPLASKVSAPIKIRIFQQDALDHALSLKAQGLNPAVINMANKDKAGGAFETGASTQEEDYFRRSNLFLSLYITENHSLNGYLGNRYQIPLNGAIYTPYVQVFRGNRDSGYAFMEKPVTVAAISVAAPDLNPNHFPDRQPEINPRSPEYDTVMLNKICATLRIAVIKGHDSIVLSALGCGAFKNNPNRVAHLFRIALVGLKRPEFHGKFKAVDFAILGENYSAFQYAFRDGLKI